MCVEEHFYIFLPGLFIILQSYVIKKQQKSRLIGVILLTILVGILFKYVSYTYTKSRDVYSAIHNRIDALSWGILLNTVLTNFSKELNSICFKITTTFIRLIIFLIAIYYQNICENMLYKKVCFHSIIPFSFALILLGIYYVDFSKLKFLRFISYYSYNWYLWHPIFVIYLTHYFGNTKIGLIIYLILTFMIAMLTTILVEEPFLKIKKKIFN